MAENEIKDKLLAAIANARRLKQEHFVAQEKADMLKLELDQVMRNHIPDIMDELSIEELKLDDGAVVSVKTNVFISPVSDAAYDWLAENGYGGLVKTNLIVAYARGRLEDAKKEAEELQARGESAFVKTDVHPQTLKAWAREQIAAAKPIPVNHFTTSSFVEANIKERK